MYSPPGSHSVATTNAWVWNLEVKYAEVCCSIRRTLNTVILNFNTPVTFWAAGCCSVLCVKEYII